MKVEIQVVGNGWIVTAYYDPIPGHPNGSTGQTVFTDHAELLKWLSDRLSPTDK